MTFNKSKNAGKKNVDFKLPEQMKGLDNGTNKLSVTNASIAERLNNKLFQKGIFSKNVSPLNDNKNSIERKKVYILSKRKNSFRAKEGSNINNKISENYKNQLSNALLLRNKPDFAKNKFPFQKRCSDIYKKNSYVRENPTSISKNEKEEVLNNRKDNSLMSKLISSSIPEKRRSHDNGSSVRDDRGNSGKNKGADDRHNNVNGNVRTPKNSSSFRNKNACENSHATVQDLLSSVNDPTLVKCITNENQSDKKKKIHFFFNFLNFKKKYSKRKNYLSCDKEEKKIFFSKEHKGKDDFCLENEVSINPNKNKKNIKSFFCVK
ncbi:conserved Plasmodium protein, unknown function [Plasmodium ovale curtisi]|nr:conserved Plasmodium protein, unknown function [Plasmodium ovale curtisi]SBS82735.1 conserved Plasmodium protein, unknown function [Plasmodium ovale curtisi]